LGDLDPNEVEVQVAYGRVNDADELPQVELTTLKQVGQRTPDGWTFEGEVPLATPGAFGYTARAVPRPVRRAPRPRPRPGRLALAADGRVPLVSPVSASRRTRSRRTTQVR